MLRERIASQSEVIRAIVSGCSPWLWGAPHRHHQQVDRLELVFRSGQRPQVLGFIAALRHSPR